MAGKTLPGIGDDESGEHDAGDSSDVVRAGDKSSPGVGDTIAGAVGDTLSRADKTPSVRPTDKMPVGVPSSRTPSMTRTILGGQAIVDDDKVAEGLKRLRSLDEPLGPIPNSMPTLKEGMAVVPGLPVPATPAIQAADLIRSRGTAHGHALSVPAVGQGLVPMTVDDRMKGTLLGHSLHLPDLPSPPEENRAPEVRSIAQIVARATPTGTQSADPHGDFSHGDARFFESEPVNTELEPEHPRSTKVVRGAAIFTAVISVFIVAAFAWSHAHKSEEASETKPPAPAAEATPAPAPTAAVDNTAVAPAGAPAAAGAAAPGSAPANTPPAAAVTPTPAPTPTEEIARPAAEPEEAVKAETPAAKLKREVAAATTPKPLPTPTPRPRSSRSAESSHSSPTSVPRPAATPGKRGKVEEDPDGTLPLTE